MHHISTPNPTRTHRMGYIHSTVGTIHTLPIPSHPIPRLTSQPQPNLGLVRKEEKNPGYAMYAMLCAYNVRKYVQYPVGTYITSHWIETNRRTIGKENTDACTVCMYVHPYVVAVAWGSVKARMRGTGIVWSEGRR